MRHLLLLICSGKNVCGNLKRKKQYGTKEVFTFALRKGKQVTNQLVRASVLVEAKLKAEQ